ncbi:MAG TPA: GNAT family N-acetyltransferase [Cellvibrio sp.]|nr:GNAT family N-acetyltransferase [Cellvibrio sp.]
MKPATSSGLTLIGVRENFRGQGIAKNIMQQVIQVSIAMGGKYLTLQASAAGEPLYRNLGFTPQFLIRNYRKN